MAQLTELLLDEMQTLLSAESQLTAALPKMASAAKNPKLKEVFTKHLAQTETHVQRLNQAFEILGGKAQQKTCRAMQGLIEAGQERIKEMDGKDAISSDLALIAAAQKVEHYEISAYGTARGIARLIGQREVAQLLSYSLGDEESADFLLTEVSKPLLQEAASGESYAAGQTPSKTKAAAS